MATWFQFGIMVVFLAGAFYYSVREMREQVLNLTREVHAFKIEMVERVASIEAKLTK